MSIASLKDQSGFLVVLMLNPHMPNGIVWIVGKDMVRAIGILIVLMLLLLLVQEPLNLLNGITATIIKERKEVTLAHSSKQINLRRRS